MDVHLTTKHTLKVILTNEELDLMRNEQFDMGVEVPQIWKQIVAEIQETIDWDNF